jgi:hypothetical protein
MKQERERIFYQATEIVIFFKKEFICSATLAPVRERAFLGEYFILFQYSFHKEFICSATVC